MKENEEIWKDIQGFEGAYLISNFGRIRSLPRRKCKGRFLALNKNNRGYYRVVLTFKGKTRSESIHKLVAEAFINNPNHYNEVNHIDGNKENNTVNNLEWCNRSQNTKHAWDNGLVSYNSIKALNTYRKNVSKPIIQYDLNGNYIKEWSSIKEASIALNINQIKISNCCHKKIQTLNNYIWKFKQ